MTEPRAPLGSKLGALVVRRDLAWLCTALLAIAIALLSLTPHPEQVVDVKVWDKIGHFIAYGALSLVFAHALHRAGRRGPAGIAIAIVGSSAFGALMEVLQGFVPPRTPDVLDAVANTMGACLGAAIFLGLSRGWRWIRSKWIRSEEATAR